MSHTSHSIEQVILHDEYFLLFFVYSHIQQHNIGILIYAYDSLNKKVVRWRMCCQLDLILLLIELIKLRKCRSFLRETIFSIKIAF
jgi:hypothetical protein